MVVSAWASFLSLGAGPRGVLLTALCTIWGVRLGAYLLWRWRAHGPDRRYVTMIAHAERDRGWGYPLASLLLVFALQLPLQFVVSLPVQLGQVRETPIGPLGIAGAVLAIVGVLFESIGDFQLTAFKADPANAGKLMRTGLWRYTRHPNYFGDACVWWGLWLIAAETRVGLVSLVGPVVITFLLTRFSGVPTVEGRLRRTRPDYDDYVSRTSGFIPWPPKRASAP
jgi:steroid 5-alpha reductase family enzyme